MTTDDSDKAQQQSETPPSKVTINNRRLTYLTRSGYAATPEIQERLFPFLYSKFILRHQTLTEKIDAERESKSRSLTKVLLDAGDHMEKLQRQRDRTDEQRAQDDARHDYEQALADMASKEVLQDRDKSREFLERIIREKFMAGGDEEFDYKTVDEDEEWDDWETLAEDLRARYFDEEDPEIDEGRDLTGETGIQDF